MGRAPRANGANGNGAAMNGEHVHVAARLAQLGVDVSGGPEACWLWRGPLHPSGYVRLVLDGGHVTGRRFVWAITHGALRPRRRVWHLCEQERCLNPAHLSAARPRTQWGLGQCSLSNLRRARAAGASILALAQRYRMTESAIVRLTA